MADAHPFVAAMVWVGGVVALGALALLFVCAFLFGAVFQSRAAIGAERASAVNPADAAKHLRRWAWGSQLILVLLLVATWDMVFKPGLRSFAGSQ